MGIQAIKASVSRGYRNPAIVDLFLFPTSNPNLQPEQGWNYDLTLSQRLSAINTQLELTAYVLRGDNLIREVVVGTPPPQKINTGNFEHRGFTLRSQTYFNSFLSLQSTYEYLDTSQPVLFAPKHRLGLRGTFQKNQSRIDLGFTYLDGLTIQTATKKRRDIPLWDVSYSFQLTPHVEMFVVGENLFDIDYEYELGYQMPGLSIQGGIKIR